MKYIQAMFLLNSNIIMVISFIVIGILVGLDFDRALKSGLYIGIAFIGLGLVTEMLIEELSPLIASLSTHKTQSGVILDVGWPMLSEISLSTSLGVMVIFLSIICNILLYQFELTDTLNLDIWNYWHYSFVAYLVYLMSNSYTLAILSSLLNLILTTYYADKHLKEMNDFYDEIEGLNFVFPMSTLYIPFARIFNYLLDKTFFLSKINFNEKHLEDRFGSYSDPAVIGFLVGLILSFFARYNISSSLEVSLHIGAAMLLIPKITTVLSEGLLNISRQVEEAIHKKKGQRSTLIGVSPSFLVAHPSNLLSTLLAIPIVLFFSLINPSNHFIPIASLTAIMYVFPHVLAIFKGNIFRTTSFGVIFILLANRIIPLTASILKKGTVLLYDFPNSISGIGSLDYSGNPFIYFIYQVSNINSIYLSAAILILVICIYLIKIKRNYNQKIRST